MKVPPYCWVVRDVVTRIQYHGPGNQSGEMRVACLATGRPFHLKTIDGRLRYTGRIAGKYPDTAPARDFGRRNGAPIVEWRR